MRPIYHIISSLLLAVVVYLFSRQLTPAVIAFAVGVFIDLDHLIDFWALKPKNPFNVKLFLDSEKLDEQKKYTFVFGHSWEWSILIFVFAYLFSWNIYLVSVGLGLVLHFLLDIVNLSKGPDKYHPLTYFFFFRVFKHFKKENLIIKL